MSELENVLDANPLRPTRRFMTVAFAVGTLLGFVVSFAFYKYLVIVGQWDMKVHLFPTILFFWGLAFAVPMGSITVRVMYLTLVMGYAGLEQYQKLSVQFKEAQDDLKKAHEELKRTSAPSWTRRMSSWTRFRPWSKTSRSSSRRPVRWGMTSSRSPIA